MYWYLTDRIAPEEGDGTFRTLISNGRCTYSIHASGFACTSSKVLAERQSADVKSA